MKCSKIRYEDRPTNKLRELATKRNIKRAYLMCKSELIAALRRTCTPLRGKRSASQTRNKRATN